MRCRGRGGRKEREREGREREGRRGGGKGKGGEEEGERREGERREGVPLCYLRSHILAIQSSPPEYI